MNGTCVSFSIHLRMGQTYYYHIWYLEQFWNYLDIFWVINIHSPLPAILGYLGYQPGTTVLTQLTARTGADKRMGGTECTGQIIVYRNKRNSCNCHPEVDRIWMNMRCSNVQCYSVIPISVRIYRTVHTPRWLWWGYLQNEHICGSLRGHFGPGTQFSDPIFTEHIWSHQNRSHLLELFKRGEASMNLCFWTNTFTDIFCTSLYPSVFFGAYTRSRPMFNQIWQKHIQNNNCLLIGFSTKRVIGYHNPQ